MSYATEYSGATVNSGVCTYADLTNYNQGFGRGPVVQTPPGTPSMATTVVPNYCPWTSPGYPPKYDTLSHGQKYNCGGYFNIRGAYQYSDGKNCATKFVKRGCAGMACHPGGGGGGSGPVGGGGTGP